MGVPNSKFKGDSDYKLNYLRNEIERKSSNSKPSDQLVPEGTIETSTEKKESFTVINDIIYFTLGIYNVNTFMKNLYITNFQNCLIL